MHEYCDMPLFVLIMFSRIDLYSNDSKVPEANVPLKKVNVGYQAKTRAHNNQ
jgi:hypothetical protein